MGTAPRAWGGQLDQVDRVLLDGNSPTCAGRTSLPRRPRRRTEEQPHVHGEDTTTIMPVHVHVGTPPRARGELSGGLRRTRSSREQPHVRREDRVGNPMTPDVAGTAPPARGGPDGAGTDVFVTETAPRARERDTGLAGKRAVNGTAPPVRGGFHGGAASAGWGGNSPACAGRTPGARLAADRRSRNSPAYAGRKSPV